LPNCSANDVHPAIPIPHSRDIYQSSSLVSLSLSIIETESGGTKNKIFTWISGVIPNNSNLVNPGNVGNNAHY
jgi:hypothetical protein